MSMPIINLSNFVNHTIEHIPSLNDTPGFLNDIATAGAYRMCIKETWSMNIVLFSALNVITLIAIIFLQRYGKFKQGDRLINILFLVNVFSLTANVVIALGFKFLPV